MVQRLRETSFSNSMKFSELKPGVLLTSNKLSQYKKVQYLIVSNDGHQKIIAYECTSSALRVFPVILYDNQIDEHWLMHEIKSIE